MICIKAEIPNELNDIDDELLSVHGSIHVAQTTRNNIIESIII